MKRKTRQKNKLKLLLVDCIFAEDDGKSSKQKKTEAYILQGLDLQILSENVFYEMIEAE